MTDPVANRMEPIPVHGWAREAVGSIQLARTVSRWLFVLSAVALSLGVLAAAFTYLGYRQNNAGGFGSGGGDWLALSATVGALLGCVLPAGLLAGGGALLRVQASRYETDLLDDELPDADDADDAERGDRG